MNKLILNCFSVPFRPQLANIGIFSPKKGFKVNYTSSRHCMGPYDAALDSPGHALGFQRLSWPFLGLRCKVGLILRNLQLFPFTKNKPLGQFWDSHPYFWVAPWKVDLSIKRHLCNPMNTVMYRKGACPPPSGCTGPGKAFWHPRKANFGQFWAILGCV